MYYILEIDKIVLTHLEIRNYFSNSSLPKKLTDDFLKTIGVYVVSRERITNNSKTHKLIHDTKPILIDGEYTLKLIEIPLTESEIKEFKKERIRNNQKRGEIERGWIIGINENRLNQSIRETLKR